MNNNELVKNVKRFLMVNEPDILIGMGITGLVYATYASITATIKATNRVKDIPEDKKTKKEIFKTVWPLYLPTAVSTLLSVPCIIRGHSITTKRSAALATAFTLSETALQEYQNKAKDIVGDKKAKEIKEAASSEVMKQQYNSNNVILTENGDSLFYEPITGRFFKSTWNKIQQAANELNADAIAGNDIITLTDWFDKIGLDRTDISDFMGWYVYEGKNSLIDVTLSSSMTPDKVPCASVEYLIEPKYLNHR